MEVRLPQTINSGHGEIVRFKECFHEPGGDRILFEGYVQPDCGPILHVHFHQAEGFKVQQGVMAYQTPGSDVQYLQVGESTVFEKSVPHRFWNSSEEELILVSWAKPAGNLQRYMTILFLSTAKRSSNAPGLFDAAYLAMQYRGEFDVIEVPRAMKHFVFPVVYWIGQALGLYKKYEVDSSGK